MQNKVSVDIKQIKELAGIQFNPDASTPSQALATTVAALVSHDSVGPQGNLSTAATTQTVLKYIYPNYTAQQLTGATITPDQAVAWLHSVGYTATIINRPLTTTEIKADLDKSEPIVTILTNQNVNDWLRQNYAGILYAHDDVTAGTQTLHKSFIKSVNYGETEIQDGQEAAAFSFPDETSQPDPVAQQDSFKWVSTITDIKQDPSWTNSQSIVGSKATGIFASKLSKSGTQSELDFTDKSVTGLLNKYPHTNTDQSTKLAAVSLINLYEDAAHQKTVADLDSYLKISAETYISVQQIENWYQNLGFDFDTIKGRAPMALTQAINNSGRLYLTLLDASSAKNTVKNTAVIGAGYIDNSFGGYMPLIDSVKDWEQIEPSFVETPTTPFSQIKQEMDTFDYSSLILGLGEYGGTNGGTYSENTTIYNIRAKGLPDSKEVTKAPTSTVTTPTQVSNVKPAVNASYVFNPNFQIRETQGQQPWCSEYVNAAAVNTVNKTIPYSSPITAQAIMQADLPKLSSAVLAQTPGDSIQNIFKIMASKYGVTADVINRPLTFAEVKAQIDKGEIVQIDADSQKLSTADGTVGHALAIVGYVMPVNSTGTPYYEVWNPWWNGIFYLSANSKTFTLSGLTLTWDRTWTNWRKSSAVGTIASDTVKQGIDGSTRKNIINTNFSIQTKIIGPFNSILNPMKNKNIVLNSSIDSAPVKQLGQIIPSYDAVNHVFWGYSYGKYTNTLMGAFVNSSMGYYGAITAKGSRYISLVQQLGKDWTALYNGGSMALVNACVAVGLGLLSGPSPKAMVATMSTIFGGLSTAGNWLGFTDDPAGFYNTIKDYISTADTIKGIFPIIGE